MQITYRNSSVSTLRNIAEILLSKGFNVSDVVIPENPWTQGQPYLHTDATHREISLALREANQASLNPWH